MSKALDQMNVVSDRPLNAETPRKALQQKLTPNNLFYVRNHFDIPEADSETWSLEFSGALKQAGTFSIADLKALPQRSQIVVLECAGNGRINLDPLVMGTTWGEGAIAQAEFTGISLSRLLDLVGIAENVIEVLFTGADSGKVRTGETTSYARSLPLDLARHPDILVAWQMNGQPLPSEHGYPLRLLVPKHYGMSSVKWLNRIDLLTEKFDGFFQADEYVYMESEDQKDGSPVEEMRVRSLFASHEDGETLSPGQHQFSGIAWSGLGEITEVALSRDAGATWQRAELQAADGPYAWASWKADLNLEERGEHILLLRASDGSGMQQPLEQYWNRGGYGNNIAQKLRLVVS